MTERAVHVDDCGAPACGDWSDGGDTNSDGSTVTCRACELDASAVAREDVEALRGALFAAFPGLPDPGTHEGWRRTWTEQAERFLSSSWLAAHDEGVRAAERERLAAERAEAAEFDRARGYDRPRAERAAEARRIPGAVAGEPGARPGPYEDEDD